MVKDENQFSDDIIRADKYYNSGLLDKASEIYWNILKINPDVPNILNNLGIITSDLGNRQLSIELLKKAVEISPDCDKYLFNLGNVYLWSEKWEDAKDCYIKCLNINPEYTKAYYNLAHILIEQGEPGEAIRYYHLALKYKDSFNRVYSNILLCSQYVYELTDEELKKSLSLFGNFCSSITKYTNYPNIADPEKRIKVGYVSPDFQTHPCASYIEPLLSGHNKNDFEIVCFAEVKNPDFTTQKLKKYPDRWFNTTSLSDNAMIDLIRRNRIDILVDLAGHTNNNRLTVFAAKPAPIQVTWFGFPASTGLKEIDYKISDSLLTPENGHEYFSEELIYMNRPSHCWRIPVEAHDIEELPCLKNNFITFGSLNNPLKINDFTLDLWAEVMANIKNSRLIIKGKQAEYPVFRNRVISKFQNKGISNSRIDFEGISFHGEHFKFYNKIDIMLDTFPYNGAVTTLDSLWMGVPVVSLAGKRFASRYGLSFLTSIGLSELVAHTFEEYIKIAVLLSKDKTYLSSLRNKLRKSLETSSLCDSGNFVMETEKIYRQIWRKWCFNN